MNDVHTQKKKHQCHRKQKVTPDRVDSRADRRNKPTKTSHEALVHVMSCDVVCKPHETKETPPTAVQLFFSPHCVPRDLTQFARKRNREETSLFQDFILFLFASPVSSRLFEPDMSVCGPSLTRSSGSNGCPAALKPATPSHPAYCFAVAVHQTRVAASFTPGVADAQQSAPSLFICLLYVFAFFFLISFVLRHCSE